MICPHLPTCRPDGKHSGYCGNLSQGRPMWDKCPKLAEQEQDHEQETQEITQGTN